MSNEQKTNQLKDIQKKTTITFLHMGDTHLGYKQYQNKYRIIDFNKAFREALFIGIRKKVDFIIHTGDFFHHNNPSPETISACIEILFDFHNTAIKELNRDIPIIAIQGNHDLKEYGKMQSWMEILSDLGLLYLLDFTHDDNNNVFFQPFNYIPKRYDNSTPNQESVNDFSIKLNYDKRVYGRFDYGFIRIYGVSSLGTSTKSYIPMIQEAIRKDSEHFNILMMHFGIENLGPKYKKGISSEIIENLKAKVNYLALGHFHRMYRLPTSVPTEEQWIFNPGSTEMVEIGDYPGDEEKRKRGIFIVSISKNETGFRKTIEEILCSTDQSQSILSIKNRAIIYEVIELRAENNNTFDDTMTNIENQISLLGLEKIPSGSYEIDYRNRNIPILYLVIEGEVNYSYLEFDKQRLWRELQNKYQILLLKLALDIKSRVDDMVITSIDEKDTLEDIEYKVFLSKLGEKFKGNDELKEEIYKLAIEFKESYKRRELTERNVNIMKKIEEWWKEFGNEIMKDALQRLADKEGETEKEKQITTKINEIILNETISKDKKAGKFGDLTEIVKSPESSNEVLEEQDLDEMDLLEEDDIDDEIDDEY